MNQSTDALLKVDPVAITKPSISHMPTLPLSWCSRMSLLPSPEPSAIFQPGEVLLKVEHR